MTPTIEVRALGRISYAQAQDLQRHLVARRKQNLIPDQLLLLEHPHTITLGRNGHPENLLATDHALRAAGIAYHETDRGGDITYHGPGQLVGYPILDLAHWKRDVRAYARSLEQVMIDALACYGIAADRIQGCTGVWVDGKKIGAIGVHISRWVTSHGFALNVHPDLSYFGYIVPCGLPKPVTSMAQLGVDVAIADVGVKLTREFARQFDREILEPALEKAS
jgi:lipoyl(octanoyl) transferase